MKPNNQNKEKLEILHTKSWVLQEGLSLREDSSKEVQ
jgi:hypothetical protein